MTSLIYTYADCIVLCDQISIADWLEFMTVELKIRPLKKPTTIRAIRRVRNTASGNTNILYDYLLYQ